MFFFFFLYFFFFIFFLLKRESEKNADACHHRGYKLVRPGAEVLLTLPSSL